MDDTLPYSIKDIQFKDIVYCEVKQMIIAQTGINGLFDIRILNGRIETQYQIVKGQVTFDISNDCRILAINTKQKISIYQLNKQDIFIETTYQENSTSFSVINIKFNQPNSRLYATSSQGSVKIYNFSQQSNSLILLDDQLPSNNSKIQILKVYAFQKLPNYLFLTTAEQGIQVIKELLETTNHSNQITLKIISFLSINSQIHIQITNNCNFLISLNIKNGINFVDIASLQNWQIGDTPIKLAPFKQNWWPYQYLNPSGLFIQISKEDNFIYIAARANGILVVDISDIQNPKLYQNINLEGITTQILLNQQTSSLYASNQNHIQQFSIKKANLNDKYPNLFNLHQIKDIHLNGKNTIQRCYINKQDQYYWSVSKNNELMLIKIISQNPYLTQIQNTSKYLQNSNSQINNILFNKNQQTIYIQQQNPSFNIYSYDISNVNSPKLQQTINLNFEYEVQQMAFNSKNTLIAALINTSIVLIDLNQLNSAQFSKQIVDNSFQEFSGIIFAQNDRFLLVSIRRYGLKVLYIDDQKSIDIIDSYESEGGEDIVRFNLSDKYAFYVDGNFGVKIIDLSFLPQISIISQIQSNGWSNFAQLINGDNFLIILNQDKERIQIIDIQDLSLPVQLIQMNIDKQISISSCATANNQSLLINNSNGIWAIPLQTDIKIHVSIQIYDSNQNKYIQQENNELYVGMIVQIKIYFVYPANDLVIFGIYSFINEKIQPLPKWITYSEDDQVIKMQIQKEGLNEKTLQSQINTTLLLTKQRITSDSFITRNDIFIIDKTLSQIIFDVLKNISIITSINLVIDDCQAIFNNSFLKELKDEFLKLNLNNDQQQQIASFVYQMLQKSISYNPIYFQVKPSLEFNINSDDNIYIKSQSSLINMYIQIDNFQGQLFVRDVSGLIANYNHDKKNVTLIADLNMINQILSQNKILILPQKSDTPLPTNNSTVFIQIQDYINFPFQQSYPLEKVNFMKKKDKIVLAKNIQDIFNQVYDDAYVQVDGYLYFSFPQDVFKDLQDFPLTFNASYSIEHSSDEINQGSWLQFNYDSNSLRIQGQVPQSVFFKDIHVTITASNGYDQISDTFVILPRIASISLILNLILQITSPIAGLFGFYKYRSIPYNIYYKNRLHTSNEVIHIGSEYIKKIPLLNSEYRWAKKIFSAYKRNIVSELVVKINKIILEQQQLAESEMKRRPKQPSFGKGIKSSIQIENKTGSLQSQVRQFNINEEKGQETSQYNEDPLQLSIRIRCQTNLISERKLSEARREKTLSSESSGSEEESVRKVQEYRRKMSRLKQSSSNVLFIQNSMNHAQQKLINLLKKKNLPLDKQQKRKIYRTDFQDYLNSNFVCQKGKLKMKQIIQDIEKRDLSIKVARRKIKVQQFLSDLYNSNSILYISLKSFIARFLLQKDLYTRSVFRYLKNQCKMNLQYTSRDWYKMLVDIKPTKEVDKNGINIPFPRLTMKEPVFEDMLKQLTIERVDSSTYNIENNYNINLYLIKEVLFADALGLHPENIDKYGPTYGESVHSNSSHLSSIQAFIPIKRNRWLCLRKMFNHHYRAYGCSQNLMLPNWINFVQKSNLVILNGIPQKHDVEEILIRVYNKDRFILTQFMLKVVNQEDRTLGSRESFVNTMIETKNSEQFIKRKVNSMANSKFINLQTSITQHKRQSTFLFRDKRTTTVYDDYIFTDRNQDFTVRNQDFTERNQDFTDRNQDQVSESCNFNPQDTKEENKGNQIPQLFCGNNQTALLNLNSLLSEETKQYLTTQAF